MYRIATSVYPNWAQYNNKVLVRERGSRRVRGRERDDGSRRQREERFDDVSLLALKMEEGATSQGKQVVCRR